MEQNPPHEKYDSTNPIAIKLIQGFIKSIHHLTAQISTDVNTITECGCGQGHINQVLEDIYPQAQIRGFDISTSDVVIADNRKKLSQTLIYQKSIYDIDDREQADLVVCCEVLEHLENPALALKKMAALKAEHYLFSVPNEPIWRILNFMRGKYMRDWGNTPDHRNHWSRKKFIRFVEQELEVIHVAKPFPWTMLLARCKQSP